MPLPAKEVELYIEKKLAELINAQQNKEVDKLLRDLKSYNRSLKRHPTDANVYSLMAIAYIELAKQFTDAFFNEAALLALNKANELSPNNPIHLADRMTLCAEMGGYELTEKDLKTLCDLDSIPIMELAYTKAKISEVKKTLDSAKHLRDASMPNASIAAQSLFSSKPSMPPSDSESVDLKPK